MKNKFIKYVFTAACMLSFLSCKKYLDIKPKGYTIPNTVDDYERILNSVSLNKFLPTDLDQLSDDFYSVFATKTVQNDNTSSKIYLWFPEIYSSPQDFSYYSPWHLIYSNIYQYNAIINNIDNATLGTDSKKNAVKAQAKFGRAHSYWLLANLYCMQYSALSSASMGLPLVTSNNINDPLPGRGTLQRTYDFILKDLNDAIAGLPASTPTPYLPTKNAGYSLLARTYFFMGDYTKTVETATLSLTGNSALVNYNNVYGTDANGNFILMDNSKFNPVEKNPENTYVTLYSYSYGMLYQNIADSSVSKFENNDLRRMYFMKSRATATDSAYFYTPFIPTNIGFTVPEMFLTRAEANARLGNTTAALQDLNMLRQNRILASSYLSLSSSDKKQVTQWVINERRKELLFKGMRWFDMRRLSSDPDFGFTSKHYFSDGTFVSLNPGSNEYMLAIPITALNKDILQNPR